MTKESQTANDPGGSTYFVTDGGALLHRVVWPRGLTYNASCLLYIKYVQRRYPRAIIVFDGYDNGPTSEEEMDVDQLFSLTKDEFISKPVNKQKFINLLKTLNPLAFLLVTQKAMLML